jgi:hypothetical protein
MNKRTDAMLAALALISGATLIGCSTGSGEDCPEAQVYESAASDLTFVSTAQFECGGSFGNERTRGTITLSVTTQQEAVPAVEDIYRAFAADPGLTDGAMPDVAFVSEDGERFNLGKILEELGFGGVPAVSQMREKYGITPTPTP